MTEYNVKRLLEHQLHHLGKILREDILPAIGFSVTRSTNLSHY